MTTPLTTPQTSGDLGAELAAYHHALRPARIVMTPDRLGAVRPTRYSFNRMFLRRAANDGWTVERTHFDMDASGAGEAIYELRLGSDVDGQPRAVSFVAFTRVLDESQHTDRVIANRWEITSCLIDGSLGPDPSATDLLATLREQIPRQEEARLDPRVLVLTRGNRSLRFFDYLVDRLAAGLQPDPDDVGDSGYIMRSTAFYANGKYGMRSFDGYPTGHPLAVPYRAQFACAWLFRELSFDVVEHCAVAKGGHRDQGGTAVGFDAEWSRYFGLGNATGLGLVPYAFKHPRIVNSWVAVRELALAKVRAKEATSHDLSKLERWILRAEEFVAAGTDDDCAPFLSPTQLRPVMAEIKTAWRSVDGESRPFDALYRWAEDTGHPETIEWVVSLLLELTDIDDQTVDHWLLIDDEKPALDAAITVAEAGALIGTHWDWLDDVDLSSAESEEFWWVISDNTEEPRRARRSRLDAEGRDVAIDVALRMGRLRDALAQASEPDQLLSHFVDANPEHRLAALRLGTVGDPYAEPRDNACADGYLPLQLQRFQLAQYGMDQFKPKSTDWLRVTLNQGAPRATDLNAGTIDDDWALPPLPMNPPPNLSSKGMNP